MRGLFEITRERRMEDGEEKRTKEKRMFFLKAKACI